MVMVFKVLKMKSVQVIKMHKVLKNVDVDDEGLLTHLSKLLARPMRVLFELNSLVSNLQLTLDLCQQFSYHTIKLVLTCQDFSFVP